MAYLHNVIYDEIHNDFLNTDSGQANQFVTAFITNTVPPKDFNNRMLNTSILLLNSKRKESKPERKRGLLSRKDRAKLKLLKCPKSGWKYEEFEPLREMWMAYMKENLRDIFKGKTIRKIEITSMTRLNLLLSKADYHGAQMKIIRAKNPSLLGLEGTCIMETKQTFKILSKDNKLRTVPKADCQFQIKLEDITLTVFGKYMQTRPAERSVKKLRQYMIPDL